MDIPRLITIGETMVLVTPVAAEPLVSAVDFRLHAGGAESNVASHLTQLGIDTTWVSSLGNDPLGARITQQLRARGVDMRWVIIRDDAPTGVYFKDPNNGVYYYRNNSAASRMSPDTIAALPLESVESVHVTGITPALSRSCSALIDSVFDRTSSSATRVSFDVNYREELWQRGTAAPALLSRARRADIVFVGLDEAHALWGCTTADDVRELLPEPTRLVVKDSDVGATEFAADIRTFVEAVPTEVVELVGAGDGFAAGYLAADMTGADADERLRAGHERARLVLSSTSDFVSTP